MIYHIRIFCNNRYEYSYNLIHNKRYEYEKSTSINSDYI